MTLPIWLFVIVCVFATFGFFFAFVMHAALKNDAQRKREWADHKREHRELMIGMMMRGAALAVNDKSNDEVDDMLKIATVLADRITEEAGND